MLLKARMKMHEHQEKYLSISLRQLCVTTTTKEYPLWESYHFFSMSYLSFSVICQVANILGPEDLLQLLDPVEA